VGVGTELEALADPVELRQLRLLEARVARRVVGAGVHHRRVEEGREEVVAEVVVGADVGPGAALGVLRDEAADSVEGGARASHGGTQPAVLMGQAAGGDLDQRDQVVGLPEPVDVALAEPDRAVQRAAPGGRVFDPDGGAQPAGLAEDATAPVLDDLDLTAPRPAQHRADHGAGRRVPHRTTSAPSGWGW
jgi:hypothetical protein